MWNVIGMFILLFFSINKYIEKVICWLVDELMDEDKNIVYIKFIY